MTLLGAYRHSGVTAASGSASATIINIGGFQPSGLKSTALLGVALYCWSGSHSNGYWTPLRVDYLK